MTHLGRVRLIENPARRIVAAVIGATFFLLLFAASAHAVDQRDVIIKVAGPDSTLYYLSSEGKRYVFPNEKTFFSWQTGFSDVQEIPIDELIMYSLVGNVTYRPGFRLVKITTDPKVYAIAPGGVLRWVTSEAVAARLYGSDWNTKIDDIPDEFFINYTIGDPISTDAAYDPIAASKESTTIGADKGLTVTAGARTSDTWIDVGDAATVRAAAPQTEQACMADTWTCSTWGSCPSGLQTRSCVLTADCPGVDTPMPETARSCTVTESVPSCTEDEWTCGSWSACSEAGSQTRTCTRTTDCPGVDTPTPVQSQSCEAPAPVPASIYSGLSNSSASVTVDEGAENVPLLAVTLKAVNADATLMSLTFTALVDADGDGTYARGTESGISASSMLTSCNLFEGDAQIGPSTDPNTSGMVGFGLLTANISLPRDVTKTFTVKCDLPDGAGGHRVALSLANADDIVAVVARTTATGQFLTKDDTSPLPINGNGTTSASVAVTVEAPVQYGSPVVSLVALPTATLAAGENVALRFAVSADGGDISLKQMMFAVSPSLTDATLATTTGSSVRQVGSPSNIGGTAQLILGEAVTVQFSDEQVILSGSSAVYDLRLAVSGTVAAGDSLTASLSGDDAVAAGGQLSYGPGGVEYLVGGWFAGFVWSNMSADPHSDDVAPTGSADWYNAFGVAGLPSGTQTLIK